MSHCGILACLPCLVLLGWGYMVYDLHVTVPCWDRQLPCCFLTYLCTSYAWGLGTWKMNLLKLILSGEGFFRAQRLPVGSPRLSYTSLGLPKATQGSVPWPSAKSSVPALEPVLLACQECQTDSFQDVRYMIKYIHSEITLPSSAPSI